MRKAVSITLSSDNLLWLKGQVTQAGRGSVSELLDRLVTEARGSGWADASAVRSVVGTVDLPDDDPGLETADDLTVEPVLLAEEPRVNRDPFDGLICAAVRNLKLPLITRDADIRSAGW